MSVDQRLLNILVCPACLGGLSLITTDNREELRCPVCLLAYPVRNGIPIMLIGDARRSEG